MNSSKSTAIKDLKWATDANRIGLEVCGIWPHESRSGWRQFCAEMRIPVITIAIIIAVLIPNSVAVYKTWGNLTLVTESLYILLPTLVSLCKYFTIWYHKKVIITMIDIMKIDWMKIKSDSEKAVMLRYASMARSITICGYVVVTIVMLSFFFPVMFGFSLRTISNIIDTGDRPLIYPTVYFYDVYQTPVYELTNLSQALTGLLIGYNYTNVSTLFGAIIMHVCGQLENLQIRIEKMVESDTTNFQEMFELNVQEHQRLIRFVDLIENTFHLVLLVIVMTFCINLCAQGIDLINLIGDPEAPLLRTFFSIIYTVWSLFLMFLYSAAGEILVTRCESLTLAVYACDWFNLKPKKTMQMIPVLVRSQRSLHVTIGKFVPLSCSTFATLLKTSAGYISFVLAVSD